MIRFANWYFLLLLPAIPALFWVFKKKSGLMFSSVKLLRGAGGKKTVRHQTGKALVICGLALSIVALARPQATEGTEMIGRQGIDIAMVLDVSGSMQSVDFQPSRLEVAKDTMDKFISGRVSDRIALIIFAGTAYTRVPLTLDHNVVRESLAGVSEVSVNAEGTAIGMAVSVGINRLMKSDAPSRVMILATDGDNNAGEIDPLTACNLARDAGIKIYTIGVGSDTMILPVQIMRRTQYRQYQGGFDEKLLKQIAETTGGRYYRAMDSKALGKIFNTIDQLERTEFQDDNFMEYLELAYPFIAAALILMTAGAVLDRYVFVQIP